MLLVGLMSLPACADLIPETGTLDRPRQRSHALTPSLEISNDVPVEGPALGPAFGSQDYPSVATATDQSLIVWRNQGTPQIRGARISSDGVLLDELGLDISAAEADEPGPRVASDGSNYLVVWESESFGADVHAALVTADGSVSDDLVIAAVSGQTPAPAVASDGDSYFVVWADGVPESDIFGARVDADGEFLDSEPIAISALSGSQFRPALAARPGGNYFVGWTDVRGVYGTRVTPEGEVLDPDGIPLTASGGGEIAVAASASGYMLAWSSNDIVGVRVMLDGTVSDATPISIGDGAETLSWRPSLASDGTDYFAIWSDRRSATRYDLYGARISAGGDVLDPSAIRLSAHDRGNVYYPSVAWDGESYLLAWADAQGENLDIYSAREPATEITSDPEATLVSAVPTTQSEPSLASEASAYLTVWTQNGALLYGGRVDAAGEVLDSFRIATNAVRPTVAPNGTTQLVVWSDERYGELLFGVRLADGQLLDARPWILSDTTGVGVEETTPFQQGAAAASNGATYFVAWVRDEVVAEGTGAIVGTLVSADGTIASPSGIVLGTGPQWQLRYVSVASDGWGYLVLWQDISEANGGLWAARISAEGFPIDAPAVPLAAAVGAFAAASDGSDYLVTWSIDQQVYMTAIPSEGPLTAHEPSVLPSDPERGIVLSLTLASDGLDYLAAWTAAPSGFGGFDLVGVFLDGDGNVWDPGLVDLSASDLEEHSPRLASTQPGRWLLAYAVSAVDPPVPSYGNHLRARVLKFGDLGEACIDASECDRGFCVDGVCCDSACGGGDPQDCEACSISAGGPTDGACRVAGPSAECRAAVGPCDVAEVCSGRAVVCPEDGLASATLECRPSVGPSDVADFCTGLSAECPDEFVGPGGDTSGGADTGPNRDAGTDVAAEHDTGAPGAEDGSSGSSGCSCTVQDDGRGDASAWLWPAILLVFLARRLALAAICLLCSLLAGGVLAGEPVWREQATLAVGDPLAGGIGRAIALSGDTALLGAGSAMQGGMSEVGRAYVLVQGASRLDWEVEAVLLPDAPAPWLRFGQAVSLDGDTALVGAYGSAYVFARTEGGWMQIAHLTDADPEVGDRFGEAVLLRADTAFVGEPESWGETEGTVWVLQRASGEWQVVDTLTGSDGTPGDRFGAALAATDTRLFVGAPGSQRAYVFELVDGQWVERDRLEGSDIAAGEWFGASIAWGDGTLLVGAPYHGHGGVETRLGAAYAFTEMSEGIFGEPVEVLPADATTGRFSSSVALVDGLLWVGAPEEYDDVSYTSQAGAIHVFALSEGSAAEVTQLNVSATRHYLQLGLAMTVDENRVLVGGAGAAFLMAHALPQGDACDATADCLSDYCDEGICYRNPLNWFEQSQISANDPESEAALGTAIAATSSTIIVGAPGAGADGEGRTLVFGTSPTAGGVEETILAASDGRAGDAFGTSVSLDGGLALVGAPGAGAVYVFEGTDEGWSETAALAVPGAGPDDAAGASVALSGGTALVGAPTEDDEVGADAGAAYVFVLEGTDWSGPLRLVPPEPRFNLQFGSSVAISGEIALIGSRFGYWAHVYVLQDGSWQHETTLTGRGEAVPTEYAEIVALSGDTAAIASPDSGTVYVFTRVGDEWTPPQVLAADPLLSGHWGNQFGSSLALSADLLVIGAPGEAGSTGHDTGAVYVYRHSDGTFSLDDRLLSNDADAFDTFGTAVAAAPGLIAIGAPGHAAQDIAGAGSAYIFRPVGLPGDACEANRQCAADHCADGICCPAECDDDPCANVRCTELGECIHEPSCLGDPDADAGDSQGNSSSDAADDPGDFPGADADIFSDPGAEASQGPPEVETSNGGSGCACAVSGGSGQWLWLGPLGALASLRRVARSHARNELRRKKTECHQ